MTDNSSLAYPADYYYPEFIYSRPDGPPTSPPLQLPLTSIDNGTGSSTKVPTTVHQINETRVKQQPASTRLGVDVVTNQGLPDNGMTQSVRTDPTNNLLRDPAERNIAKLIVDDSVIKQSVQTSKSGTNHLGHDYDPMGRYNQYNNGIASQANGHINGDLTNRTRLYEPDRQQTMMYANDGQQTMMYANDEQQPIDDHWKKEVLIDDQGVVTIEPVTYEEPVYDGPFGLTRQGSYIFYIGMGIFTLIAAIFLIMTGVFYAQNYPDSSNNAGKLAGIGICAFAFYLGLQLILIGIWHQKHREENPKKSVKSLQNQRAQTHLTTTKPVMNDNHPDNNAYDFAYQPQVDYTSYENYPNASQMPYGNEQMLLQNQAQGNVFYQPIVWPPSGEAEAQPDPKFYQPMEWTYGSQAVNGAVPAEPITTNETDKSEKKTKEKRSRTNKNAVEVDLTSVKPDRPKPKSTAVEQPLPRLNKAPETKELIQRNAELENTMEETSSPSVLTEENVNRAKTIDDETETSSLHGHQHRHSDRHGHRDHHSHDSHHHHHHHRHRHRPSHHHRRRHHSTSPCSICSHNEFHSDVGYNTHQYSHYAGSVPIYVPPHLPALPKPSPTKIFRDNGVVTDPERVTTKDSSVTADLEDVSINRENSLRQIPVVRRTVIVEPYPAEPTTHIVVTPRTNRIGKFRLNDNHTNNEHHNRILSPQLTFLNNTSRKNLTESRDNIIEELNLDDIHEDGYSSVESRKKKRNRISAKKTVKNAFYN